MTQKPTTYKTTCSYCGVGCGIVIHKAPDGKLTLEGDKDNPVNKGKLCSKGRNLLYVVNDTSDRLTQPMMRKNIEEEFKKGSWNSSMDYVTTKVKQVIRDNGPDAVGFYVSGQCLTEEYYVTNKLVKGFIGTNNIDTNSRLCMSSAVMGYKMALGDDAVPASYDDIELADCFLISGANPAWCHPILFRRLEEHKLKNPKVKIIVIDPRETDTCSIADIHLQIRAGTDIRLTNAIAKVIIEEGLIDYDFVKENTEGFELLAKNLSFVNLEEEATNCGVSVSDIKCSARLIGNSKGFISLWAMGLNQSSEGVNKNLSLLNLSLITGHIGKPGSGPLSLTGQPNAMGGREVGGMATLLAAHHDLANPEHRKKVQKFWKGKKISDKPGLTATEMLTALEEGKLKVLWIICTNPMVSLPDLHRAEKAMKNAELVIVQDISNKSDSIDFAHVVFPAAGWLEKDGTMTNSDRRISYLNKVIAPPGNAKADVEILCEFAKQMGYSGFDYKNSEEIFNEYRQLTQGKSIDISALSYTQLKRYGAKQWPVTLKAKEGTPRLFTNGKFYTANTKAKIHSVKATKLEEQTSKELPLTLTTGRVRDHWHTLTRTGKVKKLDLHIDKPSLSIHPEDATSRNIQDGDMVTVYNKRGCIKVLATIDSTIKKGVIFLPMHWGKIANSKLSRANNLTSSNIDPVSKQPEYKYSAVNVKKIVKLMSNIVIIGAGAAAYSFIMHHRKYNKKDKITVFSNEPNAFYDRIQLPEYINETKEWTGLKTNDSEIAKLNVIVKTNNGIRKIDRINKFVVNEKNESFHYDKLIIATGSQPNVDNSNYSDLPGIFTIRTRYDADNIKTFIKEHNVSKATIVGSGILGLEIADALNKIDLDVNVLVRRSKILNKQLDTTAAKLLAREFINKGINILFNSTLKNIEQKQNCKLLHLSDEQAIEAHLVIFAIGISPNIELAKKAGLLTNKGIIVNEFLQTSDASIYALGETAEFKGNSYGITMAAKEQAKACANFFAGNYFDHYKGSIEVNLLKCSNISLCSMGVIKSDDPTIEEIILLDSYRNYYKKCLVKNDRLIGAILLGDISEFNSFKELISSQTELGDQRDKLLRSSEKNEPIIGDLVCSCNQVGKGNIESFISNGCTSFEGLMVLSKAGTGCGSCKPEVKKILETSSELQVK